MHIFVALIMGLTVLTIANCYMPSLAMAVEWTPLVTVDTFTGIRTDLLTTAGGIISLLLIIVGLALLYKVLT